MAESHRLYLTEDQMPKQWYNLRADMKESRTRWIHPGTHQPAGRSAVFHLLSKVGASELDNDTPSILIFQRRCSICISYCRPSPLCRAYTNLEALDTPAKITTTSLRAATPPEAATS